MGRVPLDRVRVNYDQSRLGRKSDEVECIHTQNKVEDIYILSDGIDILYPVIYFLIIDIFIYRALLVHFSRM